MLTFFWCIPFYISIFQPATESSIALVQNQRFFIAKVPCLLDARKGAITKMYPYIYVVFRCVQRPVEQWRQGIQGQSIWGDTTVSWCQNRRFRWKEVDGATLERPFFAVLFVFWGLCRGLPLALYYPCTLKTYCTIFSAATICTLSTCFTNSASASYTPPAYSCLSATTFVRIQIVILLSRCECARNASIFSACGLPFGNTFDFRVAHDRSFEVFTQTCTCWSTISKSSSPQFHFDFFQVQLVIAKNIYCTRIYARSH